ncbi:kinase-like protein [Meira miltonrushii]|uniref:non-specific serine/threonine protein kinase n=1 Tax=Meira miltonrushii TaxID=1280837 RepID=A0A316V0Y5_9BASI|nr:kinase-like protein [Meira miltonrushii]PWN31209.1 kinase-like protein [Meira miltonrushii]
MTSSYAEREAAWYEHEERMRPSYIMRPSYGSPNGVQPQPPLSPSSRWTASTSVAQHQQGGAQYPFPGTAIDYPASPQKQLTQSQQPPPPRRFAHSVGQSGMRPLNDSSSTTRPISPTTLHSMAETGRTTPMSSNGEGGFKGRPYHLNSSPSRLHSPANGYQPFALDDEEARRTGAVGKGSAFMHKGFFDILSLVNNPASRPAGQNGFKATFSKATGRFRRDSNPNGPRIGLNSGGKEDPFFSSPAPPLQNITSRNSMQMPPLMPTTRTNRMSVPVNATYNPMPSPFPNAGAAALGPKAAKKRISIDMVGAPRIDSFVHAAHASDAEQAEEILRRWGRDNVGKIADPAWIERCKEAMRVQAARNQAEAIAQIQAALHQESAFRDNPKQLHIVNGTPSALTFATATTATVGHSTLSGNSTQTQRPSPGVGGAGAAFEQIEEEVQHNGQPVAPMTPPHKSPSPPHMAQSPIARPGMMPRTNTQGTMLVSSPVNLAKTQDVPDYLHFQPQPVAVNNAIVEHPRTVQPIDERRSSKAIDGLPGGGGAIDALFDRPVSMVVRDSLAMTNNNNHNASTRNLAGEAMSDVLVNHAGAAMRPSLTTVEKSVAAKIYFENLYYGILKKPQARETRKAGLEAELALLRIPDSSKEAIRNAWAANETEYLRDIRARVNVNSFSRLKTIGHGAFGVVALVQERQTGGLYAMKQLRKADMLRKGQEGHVRAERDLMTSASASQNAKWIVKLVYSFQDVDHLYLIMEFMGGGDLLNLLIEKDIFAEDFARFYVAEMILAVHEAHRLGYIHRDIKPDNFLFTSQGHVKLADFGLCQSFHWAHDGAYYDQQRKNMLKKHGIDLEDSGTARAGMNPGRGGAGTRGKADGTLTDKELKDVMSDRHDDGTPLTHVLTWREKNRKKIAYSVVGTNNYMAPEVLRGLGYDQSCDWWSLGVIVFEMLYGYPPFVSKSRHLTRQKILNWRQTLRFPPKPKVSRDAQDFISKLICERDDRLGSQATASVSRPNSLLQGSRQQRSGFAAGGNPEKAGLVDGVEELMAHPWFRGIDWANLHQSKAPFVPALSHPADTKHFEDDIDDEPLPAPGAAEAAKNGQPAPVEQARDPMLRDKAHGQHLLEMRKQLAFVGYTFKSPKSFDPKAQLTESKIVAAERGQAQANNGGTPSQLSSGSRLRSMSM